MSYSLIEEVWQDDFSGKTILQSDENPDLLKPTVQPPRQTKVAKAPSQQPDEAPVPDRTALADKVNELAAAVRRLEAELRAVDTQLRARNNDLLMYVLAGAALMFVLHSFSTFGRR